VFLLIDLRWRDSEVLKAGYWLIGRELLTTDSVKRTLDPTRQTRNSQARVDARYAIVMISLVLTFREIFDLPVQRTSPSGEKLAPSGG
jgi:hypothetical protein